MKQKIYQVDAFADKLFSGNPAAVCPLEGWLSDSLMQNIAMENNLSETAFYVKERNRYHIRWFTPAVEVALCGHATLAAAYVIFNFENHEGDLIIFLSPKSGELTVTRQAEKLTLNFPADKYEQIGLDKEYISGFNIKPVSAFRGRTDLMLIFSNEDEIRSVKPDFEIISKFKVRGVIITAKGNTADFVSRFFAPQSGVNEDPVTGSSHTTLIPFWAKQLGKTTMTAIQVSGRQGHLQCRYMDERVEISGEGKLYMKGEINLE